MSDNKSLAPSKAIFQKLTKDFADITCTNEALAQTFLQDHDWDLEKSVSAFFKALSEEKKLSSNCQDNFELPSSRVNELTLPTSSSLYDSSTVEKLFGKGKTITTDPPPRMKLISWNLDGLDIRNLKKRTRVVIKLIQKHEPDIVYFQEVIPESSDYIEAKLPEYKCIKGGMENYFTMTLLRIFTIFYDNHSIIDYPGSQMGRNLLVTEAHMGKLKLKLLNTHLESTNEHAFERQKQLKSAFSLCESYSNDFTIIFGGDLNLRDKEAVIPKNFYDTWEFCGSPHQFKYTWDMTKNMNNSSNFGRFKPKCRFDRVYFKFSIPKRAYPKHFALIGSEKVPQTQSFPSDHWGVCILFDLDHSV